MRTIRTAQNRARFLAALIESGNVHGACRVVGVSRNAMYEWRAEDRAFAEEWEEAVAVGIDVLEDEAMRRAMAGSDPMLMFLLRCLRPEIYSQKAQRKVVMKQRDPDYSRMTKAELNAELAKLRAEQGDLLPAPMDDNTETGTEARQPAQQRAHRTQSKSVIALPVKPGMRKIRQDGGAVSMR